MEDELGSRLDGGLEDGLDGGLEDGLDGGLEDGLEGGLEDGLEGGLEDGLDSSFGFSIISTDPLHPTGLNRACNANFSVCSLQGVPHGFQTEKSGLLAFHADYTSSPARERLSVYKFLDHEVFGHALGGVIKHGVQILRVWYL